MSATSAYVHFTPRIIAAYQNLAATHHTSSYSAGCGGCHLAAEAVFQEAMRAWEWFVKEVLIDLMQGMSTAHRNPPKYTPRGVFANHADARTALLRTKYVSKTGVVQLKNNPGNFLLLHSPDMVIKVARYWVQDSPIETVYQNYKVDISNILKLRHGLSHGTLHAQIEARNTMMQYDPSKQYNSIGHFLLARPSINASTWIDTIIGDLHAFAALISP
jgi:hypothetical protein